MSIPPPPGSHPPPDPQGSPGPYASPQYPNWGQGQGPYGPQGPYGGFQAPYGPHSPYGARAAVNGVAIAALVLGVLCFLPAAGLVLGLVALRQIRRKGERGRGMAIGGAVLSSVGLALWVVSLSTGFASDVWEGFKDGARGNESFSLRKGDCFDSPGGLEGDAYDVDPVSCDGQHDGEVFAVVTLPKGAYPGDGRITDTADDKCYALQDGYAMDTWAVPEDVDVYYLLPSRESWSIGDREIVCVFGSGDGKGSLTGSLRRDATTLDAHQLAYLKASRVLNTAMDTAPEEEYVEDDLPGHKAWAGRVASALAEQAGILDGHTWPAAARKPLADLVRDLRAAEGEWARASDAADVDTFYEHYDKGYDLIDPKKSVTARKALGLATTPPSYEEGDSGGGGDSGTEV